MPGPTRREIIHPKTTKSSSLFSLVTQSQVLYSLIGICNDLSMGLHNEQLHMVVKVPPSHCLTQSYNGWGKSKELWVMEMVT